MKFVKKLRFEKKITKNDFVKKLGNPMAILSSFSMRKSDGSGFYLRESKSKKRERTSFTSSFELFTSTLE